MVGLFFSVCWVCGLHRRFGVMGLKLECLDGFECTFLIMPEYNLLRLHFILLSRIQLHICH